MADLDSLKLNDEGISEDDFDKMPTGLGAFTPPPQPGTYRFRLPHGKAIFGSFETLATPDQGQKIVAVLNEEAALRNESLGGEKYNARVSNRTRLIKGDTVVSDMGMLLKAVGVRPEPNEHGIITNAAYGKALVEAAEKVFLADHSLTASCNETRPIYKDGQTVEGTKGCGQRYAVEGYSRRNGGVVLAIPRTEDGKVALRFACKCGAELRCFGELRGYRSAE